MSVDIARSHFVTPVALQREDGSLIAKFGENAEDGPHSVYGGGLWVRTAYDGRLQDVAEASMRRTRACATPSSPPSGRL